MPFQPGGHFGQAGWSGETGVCRAASGAAIKGPQQRWRRASAIVGAGWLAVRLRLPGVGGGEAAMGAALRVTSRPGVPGT